MATVGYNDSGSVNSVKILGEFQQYSEYIMLFTELDSHIVAGDKVYVTLSTDIGDVSERSIILDNFLTSAGGDVYSTILQGYNVLYVDRSRNGVVIDRLFSSVIGDGEDISDKTIESQYISKVSCHNITVNNASIDSTTIKHGDVNSDGGYMELTQMTMFGGIIRESTVINKYDKNYVTQNMMAGIHKSFSSNNTDIGVSNGYTYIYNTVLYNCDVDGGNLTDCTLTNDVQHTTSDGMFTRCTYDKVTVNGGYHKDVVTMSPNTGNVWNGGYYDCDLDFGTPFTLPVWGGGEFIRGYLGGYNNKVEWLGGIFHDGVFDAFMWRGGTFNGGVFGSSGRVNMTVPTTVAQMETHMGVTRRKSDGNRFEPGVSNISELEYTTWAGGTFNGGTMICSRWLGGELGNGVVISSVIHDITMYGGTLLDVTIRKGNIMGGNILMRSRSTIINGCDIYNCNIGIYDDGKSYYDNNSVRYFIDSYKMVPRNDSTLLVLTDNNLISPTITDVTTGNKKVFVSRQSSVTGGNYNNINFTVSLDFTCASCSNCNFTYGNSNAMFCVARQNTVLITTGTNAVSTRLIMLEFDNMDTETTQFIDEDRNDEMHGFSYVQLNYPTQSISDRYVSKIAKHTSYYNPRTTDGITYSYISPNNNSDVTVDITFNDNSFGDFGVFYSPSNGRIYSNNHNINGGIYDGCSFSSDTINRKLIYINDGTFNSCTFGKSSSSQLVTDDGSGFIVINGGDFNNATMSSNILKRASETDENIIKFNAGNFNSGVLGVVNSADNNNEIFLSDGSSKYKKETPDDNLAIITDYTDVPQYNLTSIHPIILRKGYYSDEGVYIEQIGSIHDTEYERCYIDVWNQLGLDFDALETTAPWSSPNDNNDFIIVPSYMVAVIECSPTATGGNSVTAQEHLDIFMKFLDKGQPFIVDMLTYNKAGRPRMTYNELYNRLVSNYNQCDYKGFYKNTPANKVALVFKFDAIDMVYNNIDDIYNNNFDNFFRDYNRNYKNAWSDANSGYAVRPMPVYKQSATPVIPNVGVTITNQYSSYPVPANRLNWIDGQLPPPWFFDNSGKLWYPFKKENYTYSDGGYGSTSDYSGTYFTITDMDNTSQKQYYTIRSVPRSGQNSFHFIGENINSPDTYISKQISLKNNFGSYIQNTSGPTGVMRVNANNVNMYLGGWEQYTDRPYQFGYNRLTAPNSYTNVYIQDDASLLQNVTSGEVIHVTAHAETHGTTTGIEYDGPVTVATVYPSYKTILINRQIASQYGRLLKVKTLPFTIVSISTPNITIEVSSFSTRQVNYELKSSSKVYLYHPSFSGKLTVTSSNYNQPSDKLTLILNSSTLPSSLTTDPKMVIYGLDEWEILDNIQINTLLSSFGEAYVGFGNRRYKEPDNTSYDEFLLPACSVATPWRIGTKILANFDSNIPGTDHYPNGSVQPVILTATRVVNMYDCMVLYTHVIDSSNETPSYRNTYLPGSLPSDTSDPLIERHYLINTPTNTDAYANNIRFDKEVKMGTDKHLYTTLTSSSSMATFRKTTNLYRLYFDNYAGDSSDIAGIQGLSKKPWITVKSSGGANIEGRDIHAVCKYYSTQSTSYMNVETLLLNTGTVPIAINPTVHYKAYTSFSFPKGNVGNVIEIRDYLTVNNGSYTLNRPVVAINNTSYKITFIDDNYNIDFYRELPVILFLNDTTHIEGKIKSVVKVGNYSELTIEVTSNSAIQNLLQTITRGYFFMDIGERQAQCYDKLIPTATGFETYPNNDGNPAKPITNPPSPKIELMEINKVRQTTDREFDMQAGIVIRSSYDIVDGTTKLQDTFNGGNFYSGRFYGDWIGGNWFAPTSHFMGNNFENSVTGGDFSKASDRNQKTYYNLSDVISRLVKNGEYFISPPWLQESNRGDDIIRPKVNKQDERM